MSRSCPAHLATSLRRQTQPGLGLVLPAILLGVLTGSACALFLWSLDRVVGLQLRHSWLLILLPLLGVITVQLYHQYGKGSEAGNNLLLEKIHQPGEGVPVRMAPLVLLATLLTHLGGGSAGREGTAVQMGGALAAGVGRWLRLPPAHLPTLLMCGISAGFSGVFGTPLAGTLFSLEVLFVRRVTLRAALPCLLSALCAHWTCGAWGVHHTLYTLPAAGQLLGHEGPFNMVLLAKIALCGLAFGAVSRLFVLVTRACHSVWNIIPVLWLRPVAGSGCLMALCLALGTRDYLGLGITSHRPQAVTLLSAFQEGGAEPYSWWWKLLFTAVTLSSGFKGGEVTPLFFMGATLGNVLAGPLVAPVPLLAAVGFVSIFAGATKTPLACTVMGMELFGPQYAPYFLVGTLVAYGVSGPRGIYSSQRLRPHGDLHSPSFSQPFKPQS